MKKLLLSLKKYFFHNYNREIYFISLLFIIVVFVFLPHTVELTGILETWFPYKGLIAYKDFQSNHFPLGRLILLPLHLLTNWNLRFDPFLALATALISLHLVYLYCKQFTSKLPMLAGTFFLAIFFWYCATAALFFHEMLIGLLLTASTLLIFKTQKLKVVNLKIAFIVGFLLSFAEFSGQVATPTIIVMIGLSFWLWRSKSNLIRTIKYFSFGFMIPLLGLIYYFYQQNALYDFYFWNIPYYFIYNSNPRSSFLTLPLAELFAFYIPMGLMLFSLFINPKRRDFQSIFLLLSVLSSMPFIFFSIFHPHHLNYILPILALTFSKAIFNLLKDKSKIILSLGISIFVIITILVLLPWHYQRFKSPSFEIANDTYPGDHMYETVQWVKNNTPENARILVIGDAMFYLRSNRLLSSRPGKGLPYSWEPFPQVKKELMASPAKYWIVDQRFVNRLIDAYNRTYMVEFIRSELQKCYHKVYTEENWEVYQRICN